METPAIGEKIDRLQDVCLPLAVTPGKKGNSPPGSDVLIPEIAILKQMNPDYAHTVTRLWATSENHELCVTPLTKCSFTYM
jgi:hypothetical protein